MKPCCAAIVSVIWFGAGGWAYDFEWVRAFPGGSSSVAALGLDGSNTLATGSFAGTVSFGTNNFTSTGNADLFLLKLNPTGGVVWVQQLGASSASALGLAIAPMGSAYLLGSFTGTITIGTNSFTAVSSNGYSDMFVAKIDPAEQFLWTKTFPLEWTGNGGGIALSSNGDIWITGSADGRLFLPTYDSAGNLLHHFTPTTSNSHGIGIALGTNGTVYVTGAFDDMLNLGTTNLNGTFPVSEFTAAFSPDGVALWAARHAAPGNYSVGRAVTLAPDGSVLSVGRIDVAYVGAPYPTLFMDKYSPSGEVIWARQQGAHRSIFEAQAVATDAMGNAYTAGSKNDPFTNPDPRSGPLLTAWTPAGTEAVFLRVTGSAPSESGSATAAINEGIAKPFAFVKADAHGFGSLWRLIGLIGSAIYPGGKKFPRYCCHAESVLHQGRERMPERPSHISF